MKAYISKNLLGFKLLCTVYNWEGGMLFEKGTVLTARRIMFLKQQRISVVPVDFGINEGKECCLDNSVLHNLLRLFYKYVRQGGRKTLSKIKEIIEKIADELKLGKRPASSLTEMYPYDLYVGTHSVDVSVLSMIIGAEMGYKKKVLVQLGLGSLLHDIGKFKIAREILEKPGKLTADEFKEVKKHPEYGYENEMIKDLVDPVSASIVLNHHERYDGSGYPRGLAGDEIGELEAICAVADVYNAITTDRIYRKAMSPDKAYNLLMNDNLTFNPKVMNAFLKSVAPYPVGTIVKMNNGFVGCVYKLNKSSPFKPVVKILGTNEKLDLRREEDIYITGVLDAEKVCKLVKRGGVFYDDASSFGRLTRNSQIYS